MSLNNLSATNISGALIDAGDFVINKRLVSNNQILYYTDPVTSIKTGYVWKGTLPHITSTNNPNTDGGISDTAWVPVIYSKLKEKMETEGLTLDWNAHLPTVEVAYGLTKNSLKMWKSGTTATSDDYWLYTDGTVWNGVGVLGNNPGTSTGFEKITPNFNASIKTYSASATDGQTDFNIPFTFSTITVFVNGSIQLPGLNYTVSGSTLTFTTELEAGDLLYVFIGNPNISTNDKLNRIYTANAMQGQTTIQVPYDFSTAIVYINGVLQNPSSAYSIGADRIITFAEELYADDEIIVMLGDIIIQSDDYVLKSELSSSTGASNIGTKNNISVQDIFDCDGYISVMEFIPLTYHSKIGQEIPAATTIQEVGDLYEYIVNADLYAYNNNKVLFFPAGQYPISQTYVQRARKIIGIPGASFLVPYTTFTTLNWLHTWPAVSGQPRMTSYGMSYDGLGNVRQDYVGGFNMSSGCHTSEINAVFARNCWLGGLRISPVGATRDIVNLIVERIYLLDCGSTNYYSSFSIDVNDNTTNWTDGSIRDVDISSTNSDSNMNIGPIALSINNTNKTIFNVIFERFFTSTRLNTHIKTTSNSRLLFVGNRMSNFSGETHAYINGVDTNNYYTSLPQVELQAGYRNKFDMMYPHGALGNSGLKIIDGIEPTFTNWTFQPGQIKDQNGNYLDSLNIVACEGATFRDCVIRNIISTSFDSPWKNAFTTYMHDNGVNTKWDSYQMSNNVTVQHPLSFYSNMTLKSGSSTLYFPTNSSYYATDIIFSQGSKRELIMGFPATNNITDDQNVQYPLVSTTSGTLDYYYLTAKITMTSGDINNHYLNFQMYGNFIKLTPTELNKEYIITYRFPVGTSTTLNKLIIHIGHDKLTSLPVSFTISDIILTSSVYAYPFKYVKSQVID